MERRNFLGALTGTSLGVLLNDSFAEFPREQDTAQAGGSVAAQGPFETSQVEVSGNTVFVRRYGKGPAILMVHGFPRTSLMWRSLAPKLADNSHGDLRRPARLRPKRDTAFHGRPLSLFEARNGTGTG